MISPAVVGWVPKPAAPDHESSSLGLAILLAPPPTQRYFTGVVAEGVPCPEWGGQGIRQAAPGAARVTSNASVVPAR